MRRALLLVGLAACTGRPAVIGVAQPDRPPFDDTAVDVDDTDDPETGGVEITYGWQNDWMAVTSCAEAGVETLTITVDGRDPVDYPCTDAAIRRYEVPLGDHWIEVRGDVDGGVWWTSGEVDVNVGYGDAEPVDVVLRCEEGEVDDGCGGA